MEKGLTEKAMKRLSEDELRPEERITHANVIPVDSKLNRITSPSTTGRTAEIRLFDARQLNRKRIIHPGSKDQSPINSFRYSRRKIIENLNGRKDGVVLVSSAVGHGGGSFCAINLATVLAYEAGVCATIVECNLTNSPLCKTLEIAPQRGWLDYVEDPSVKAEEIIYATGIDSVNLIPAGRSSQMASGLITLGRLTDLFDDLRANSNHFIIIDGPSLDSAGDHRVFSDAADCIVLVIPYGRVSPEKMKSSLRGIDKDKVVGVLLNKSPAVF
jgi:Mrp family chromosome partitioning ATPase